MATDKRQLVWLLDIRLLALLAGLITFLVYLPALENGFVTWDDDTYLYKNDQKNSDQWPLTGSYLRTNRWTVNIKYCRY